MRANQRGNFHKRDTKRTSSRMKTVPFPQNDETGVVKVQEFFLQSALAVAEPAPLQLLDSESTAKKGWL